MDKRSSSRRAARAARAAARAGSFDVLLHMQLALRASLIARAGAARQVKLGFDRARARELQWLFTNARIAPRIREHVLDSFFGFAEALGIRERLLRWDLPLPDERARLRPARLIPDSATDARHQPLLEPHAAQLAADALRRRGRARHAAHGMRVILAGGPKHARARHRRCDRAGLPGPLLNQIGKDTLPQLLALLARATALVTPDSGPAHMATMVGTPVVGLYAATNPARSGPYLSARWCVNAYPEAARVFRGMSRRRCPGRTRSRSPASWSSSASTGDRGRSMNC